MYCVALYVLLLGYFKAFKTNISLTFILSYNIIALHFY